MMTKKYYEMIAEVIRDLLDAPCEEGVDKELDSAACDGIRTTAMRLADAFAADNPKFDRARFLKACGVAQ